MKVEGGIGVGADQEEDYESTLSRKEGDWVTVAQDNRWQVQRVNVRPLDQSLTNILQ